MRLDAERAALGRMHYGRVSPPVNAQDIADCELLLALIERVEAKEQEGLDHIEALLSRHPWVRGDETP